MKINLGIFICLLGTSFSGFAQNYDFYKNSEKESKSYVENNVGGIVVDGVLMYGSNRIGNLISKMEIKMWREVYPQEVKSYTNTKSILRKADIIVSETDYVLDNLKTSLNRAKNGWSERYVSGYITNKIGKTTVRTPVYSTRWHPPQPEKVPGLQKSIKETSAKLARRTAKLNKATDAFKVADNAFKRAKISLLEGRRPGHISLNMQVNIIKKASIFKKSKRLLKGVGVAATIDLITRAGLLIVDDVDKASSIPGAGIYRTVDYILEE